MYNYKYLIWSGTATLTLLSLFLIASTIQVLNTASTTNTVSFSGEGKVTAKPDVALIDLAIVTDAPTSKAAQDQNSAKSKSLTEFLSKQGIDEKDIKTTSYNIYPQYYYPPYPTAEVRVPKITGYQVNQSVQVKIRDLAKADKILDGVVSAGVNQINNFQLTIDDPEKLKEEARAQAIKDAKAKAEKLEDQLDIDLGRIINFSENTGGYPVPVFYDKAMDSRGGMGGGGPSIPTGENEINVSVSITYQIK